jgi:phosphatidylglycerophosphate synthase
MRRNVMESYVTAEAGSLIAEGLAVQPGRPLRKRELQDALNHYLYHPLAWQLARQLAKTPLTPNMVSVIGALFVVAAGVVYARPWGWQGALLGMVLHMSWHVIDGADGDLARITGRSSPLGELVDGLCDYSSHFVLYLILGWLLAAQIGAIGWPIMIAAGVSHAVQSNHVEAQRRFYQWWVYSVPWLNTSQANGAGGELKSLLGGLVQVYLRVATGLTPFARQIDDAVSAAQARPAEIERIRGFVRQESPRLLLICKILGPNPRAIVLGLSMLAGSPVYYMFYQAVVLNLLLVWSVIAHNAAAKRIALRIQQEDARAG